MDRTLEERIKLYMERFGYTYDQAFQEALLDLEENEK